MVHFESRHFGASHFSSSHYSNGSGGNGTPVPQFDYRLPGSVVLSFREWLEYRPLATKQHFAYSPNENNAGAGQYPAKQIHSTAFYKLPDADESESNEYYTKLKDLTDIYGEEWYEWAKLQYSYVFSGFNTGWNRIGYTDAVEYDLGSQLADGTGWGFTTRVDTLPPNVGVETQLSQVPALRVLSTIQAGKIDSYVRESDSDPPTYSVKVRIYTANDGILRDASTEDWSDFVELDPETDVTVLDFAGRQMLELNSWCVIAWQEESQKWIFVRHTNGVPFINESGETVPAYGVMQVSEIDVNGLVHIVKPDGEPRNAVPYLINRGAEVFDNYMGVGDWALDGHAKALLDSSLISYTNMGSKSLDAAVGGWYLTSHDPTEREAFGFFQLGRYGTSNPTVDGVSCVIASVLQTIESPTLSYHADYELMQDFAGSSISHLSTYLGNTNGYLLFANSTGAPVPHHLDYAGIRGGWKKLDPSNPVSLYGNFECVRKGYYLIECEIPYYTTVDNENDLFDAVNTSTESSHSHTYQKLNLNKAFGDAKFASILKVNSTPIYWYKESASLCESGSHKQMYGSYSAVFDIGDQISVELSITSPGYDWSAFIINSPGDINFPRLRITRLRNWRGIV